MVIELKYVGTWREGIKKCAPDGLTMIMRGKIKIKTRPSDEEALELLEGYKDKTFDEVRKILDDARFWLQFIQNLSFDEEGKDEEAKGEEKQC